MKKWTLMISSLMLLSAGIAYNYLPDTIPTHWGIDGTADSFAGKFHVFSPVAISWMFTLGFLIVSHKTKEDDRSSKWTKAFLLLFNVIMCSILFFTIWQSLAPNSIDAKVIALPLMTITLMSAGNMMPKIKANYFIGIRTPWTLGNKHVWYKTHRFAGKVWFFGGLLLLMGFFIPDAWMEIFMFMILLLLIALPCLYSCICFYSSMHNPYPKEDKERNSHD